MRNGKVLHSQYPNLTKRIEMIDKFRHFPFFIPSATYPIGRVIQHLLPRGIEMHSLLHETLLRQRDHLLCRLVRR